MPPRPLVAKTQLTQDLTSLGIEPGDVVMMHASAKSVGWIVGGPQTIIQALLDVLGPNGTLMMLASWGGHPYEMSGWSEDKQRLCRDEQPAFDPASSPADHREMSILAEYLRTWPGAKRSAHPMASFVAVGEKARWLTEKHPLQYGMGQGSPLARLCEADGKVLLLGAPFDSLTLLHHAEHLVDLPHKRLDRYPMPILRDGERAWIDIEEFDTTVGIADFGCEDYFIDIAEAFLDAGHGRRGEVGQAESHLFSAEALKAFAICWMQTHYRGPLRPNASEDRSEHIE